MELATVGKQVMGHARLRGGECHALRGADCHGTVGEKLATGLWLAGTKISNFMY